MPDKVADRPVARRDITEIDRLINAGIGGQCHRRWTAIAVDGGIAADKGGSWSVTRGQSRRIHRHDITARAQSSELIIPVDIIGTAVGRRRSCQKIRLGAVIQIDRDAINARLPRILKSVAIRVVPYVIADGPLQGDVAEIDRLIAAVIGGESYGRGIRIAIVGRRAARSVWSSLGKNYLAVCPLGKGCFIYFNGISAGADAGELVVPKL